MDGNAALVILCGLPGSGKTYLSTLMKINLANGSLLGEKVKNECEIVCYDDWMQGELGQFSEELPIIPRSDWKERRKSIRQAAEQMIADVKGHSGLDFDCRFTKFIEDFRSKLRNRNDSEKPNVILIIDDNMHLKSMRFEYFQLARKYNIGFCQIYMKCNLPVALSRNASRVERVPDSVILAMAKRFEAPQPQRNSWEKLSFVLEDDGDHFETSWHSLDCLLQEAFDNPVPPLEDTEGEKTLSRDMCLTSVLHQADQVLRKLLSEAMRNHVDDNPELMKQSFGKQESEITEPAAPKKKPAVAEKEFVIPALEKEAARPMNSNFHVSNDIAHFAKYMREKYGENYKEMARDPRNYYQLTPKQIKKRIAEYDTSRFIAAFKIANKEAD